MSLSARAVIAACILAAAWSEAAIRGAQGSSRGIETNIRSYVTKVDDLSAVAHVISANQRELGKINKDFGLTYRFSDIKLYYKEPNKARMEGNLQGSRATLIINGTTQWFKVGRLATVKREFADSPGKRKTLMDLGLITDYYLSYTNAKFERTGEVDGNDCAVFDMTYQDRDEDTSHHRIWVDPKTRAVRKRESYSQEGKLQVVFLYKDHKEVAPGVWVPTRIEAINTDRVTAGVMGYKDIAVNKGLSDSLFRP